MSDNWDFYMLQVEDKPASIYLDLGIGDAVPAPALPYMAYIRLQMKQAREDGLSSSQEFATLNAIEDLFLAKLVSPSIAYVGRCTTDACRDFFFYIAEPQAWQSQVTQCMSAFPAYQFEANTKEDREWSTYFHYLYPSNADRQTIENRHVCHALEQNGDQLSAAREIDHWAYFQDAAAMDTYVKEATALGYATRAIAAPNSEQNSEQNRYCAQMWRADIPAYNEIDNITLPLFYLAEKLNGQYDGWECCVVSR